MLVSEVRVQVRCCGKWFPNCVALVWDCLVITQRSKANAFVSPVEANRVIVWSSTFNVVLETKANALIFSSVLVIWTFDVVFKFLHTLVVDCLVFGQPKLGNGAGSLYFCEFLYKCTELVCNVRLLADDRNIRRTLLGSIVVCGRSTLAGQPHLGRVDVPS